MAARRNRLVAFLQISCFHAWVAGHEGIDFPKFTIFQIFVVNLQKSI